MGDRGVSEAGQANCDRICRHGLTCERHAEKAQRAEVCTHVAVDGLVEHHFWHGSAGWTCVKLRSFHFGTTAVVS